MNTKQRKMKRYTFRTGLAGRDGLPEEDPNGRWVEYVDALDYAIEHMEFCVDALEKRWEIEGVNQVRTLKKFKQEGDPCPVCGKMTEKMETVLLPVADGGQDAVEMQQFHLDCLKHLIGQMKYNREKFVVYAIV